MARPPPRAIIGVLAASAVALSIGVWCVSYVTTLSLPRPVLLEPPSTSWVAARRGTLTFNIAYDVTLAVNRATPNREQGWLGFSRGDNGPPIAGPGTYVRRSWVAVPLWFVTMSAGLIALVVGRPLVEQIRQSRRSRRGECVACGYDIRATPSGVRSAGGQLGTLAPSRACESRTM